MPDPAIWPELNWTDWQPTADTLHLWTQIVGKTRLALTPIQNHWWNIPLYVSARGLTTSAMPLPGGDLLEVEFDLRRHELELRRSNGFRVALPLRPKSVASFFAEYQSALREMGVNVAIWHMPVELQMSIAFDQDHTHASYDPAAVTRFHTILTLVDPIFKRFATGFLGKISAVHFFWGSFDLCVTRFSGRVAAGSPKPDPVMQEAYSHEVSSAGFWPGNGGLGYPAFYCYAAPVPDGLARKPVHPGTWSPQLGEFLLPYEEVRTAANPEQTLLDFLQTAYAACADAAKWDRAALERPIASAPSA